MQEFAQFLTETETAYSTEMRNFLRKDLGIRANLIDSQVGWGGYTSFVREADSDYADNHAYWQHPSFQGKDWDPVNWLIQNKPMVDEFPSGGDVLTNLARYRMEGKPYSISEYNEPAPNDYRVETIPLLSTFAAHQAWNAIYTFEYGQFGTGAQNDRIQGFFDCGVDPLKAAFFPSAAILFRETEEPAVWMDIVQVAQPLWRNGLIGEAAWARMRASPLREMFMTSLHTESALGIGDKSLRDAGCTVERNATGCVYRYDGRAKAAVGHLGGQEVSFSAWSPVPAMTFRFPAFGNGFGALTVVPIHAPGRYLLTLASRAENQGMGWNKDRSSVGNNWGHGPVMAEGLPCDFSIESGAIRHAWALDPTGKRVREVPMSVKGSGALLHLGPEFRTVWYELGP